MPRDVPGIRILPMSASMRGFRGLSIARVQEKYFRGALPKRGGGFGYPSSGLNAAAGTIVLFQFQARVIASAVFLRDEKFEKPRGGCAGVMYFEVGSFRTFEPVDAAGMRNIWREFRAFGHVKQFLNPGGYAMFKRRLKKVRVVSGYSR